MRNDRVPYRCRALSIADTVWGVHPILGRGFEPAKTQDGNAHPVAVISYQLCKGDSTAPGNNREDAAAQRCGAHDRGVAPEGLLWNLRGLPMQFWVPASMEEIFESALQTRGSRCAVIEAMCGSSLA